MVAIVQATLEVALEAWQVWIQFSPEEKTKGLSKDYQIGGDTPFASNYHCLQSLPIRYILGTCPLNPRKGTLQISSLAAK